MYYKTKLLNLVPCLKPQHGAVASLLELRGGGVRVEFPSIHFEFLKISRYKAEVKSNCLCIC